MIRIRRLSINLTCLSGFLYPINVKTAGPFCLEKMSIFLNQINPQNFEFYNYEEKIAAWKATFKH